jgi:hypothetical protein
VSSHPFQTGFCPCSQFSSVGSLLLTALRACFDTLCRPHVAPLLSYCTCATDPLLAYLATSMFPAHAALFGHDTRQALNTASARMSLQSCSNKLALMVSRWPLPSVRDMLAGSGGTPTPQQARCLRTDGKKWQCKKLVVSGQKYCEKHMHRGRHRAANKRGEGSPGPPMSANRQKDASGDSRSNSPSSQVRNARIPFNAKMDKVQAVRRMTCLLGPCLSLSMLKTEGVFVQQLISAAYASHWPKMRVPLHVQDRSKASDSQPLKEGSGEGSTKRAKLEKRDSLNSRERPGIQLGDKAAGQQRSRWASSCRSIS